MKMFRGRTQGVFATELRRKGWPAYPAALMAEYLVGASTEPPAWEDLTVEITPNGEIASG